MFRFGKVHRLLALVAVLSLAAMAAHAGIIADSVADFSLNQGDNNWYYGYYTDPPDNSSFTLMTFTDESRGLWMEGQTQPPWTLLWADGGHPGGPPDANNHWAVRRWVSPIDGDLAISGHVAKSDTRGGDGISAHILINGEEVYGQFIAGTDGVGVDYQIQVTVQVGDIIDFAIECNLNTFNDATLFTALVDDGTD